MKRLLQFFKTPSSWLQNAMAQDSNGDFINMNEFPPEAKVAKLSLHGAIAYFYSFEREPERRYKMMERLSKAIAKHTGKSYYVAQYNNLPTTKFEDIQAVLKIADSL